jgi:CheY-like chemotaxis protein
MSQNNESKGNILLVDDLPENLQLLSDLLTQFLLFPVSAFSK